MWRRREEGGGERGGTTVWRRREERRGVVPPCGGRGRGREGGATVRRKRERGGCSAFVRSPLASLGAAWGREEDVGVERRRFNICEITACSEVPPFDFKSSVVYFMCSALDYWSFAVHLKCSALDF